MNSFPPDWEGHPRPIWEDRPIDDDDDDLPPVPYTESGTLAYVPQPERLVRSQYESPLAVALQENNELRGHLGAVLSWLWLNAPDEFIELKLGNHGARRDIRLAEAWLEAHPVLD